VNAIIITRQAIPNNLLIAFCLSKNISNIEANTNYGKIKWKILSKNENVIGFVVHILRKLFCMLYFSYKYL